LLVVLVLGMLVLGACQPVAFLDDVFEQRYADYARAEAAGEVERGWLPPFVPPSATDIRLRYHLDTNAQLLSYEVPLRDVWPDPAFCSPAETPPQRPALTATWWEDALFDLPDVQFYRCGDGWMAVHDQRVWFWRGAR
jgi:hypothetical protein